jgi:steroid delta-isomerase-like uncharacterized protein
MSSNLNKSLIRRNFEEGLNRRNFSTFDQLIAADFVHHSFPASIPGPEGYKQILAMFTAGFPDLRVTLEDIVAEGDRVMTRGYFTGTHKGAFMGIPPTGKTVRVSYMDVWRLEDGRIAENWVQLDMMALAQQLGCAPRPAPLSA